MQWTNPPITYYESIIAQVPEAREVAKMARESQF